MHPVEDVCPFEIDQGYKFDFVIIYDNSCGLKVKDCDNYIEGVANIISKILDETKSTRVQTMEIKPSGNPKTIISFRETTFQANPSKYLSYFRQTAECMEGGHGQTDAAKAISVAANFLDANDDRIDKMIIISACMDDRKKKICRKLNDILWNKQIEVFVVNLVKASNAENVITSDDASTYLECLTEDDDEERVCIGNTKKGVSVKEFEDILDDCLLPGICEPPS